MLDITLANAYPVAVSAISVLIRGTLQDHESERHYPGSNPDRMDDRIKATGERVKVLRAVREALENEMAKPV